MAVGEQAHCVEHVIAVEQNVRPARPQHAAAPALRPASSSAGFEVAKGTGDHQRHRWHVRERADEHDAGERVVLLCTYMTTTAANEQLDDIKTALDETEATIDDEAVPNLGDKVLLVRWSVI
jgi:hypothetical protein